MDNVPDNIMENPLSRRAVLEEFRFVASSSRGEVSALLLRPPEATCLYVLAHGAGAGMRHRFLDAMAYDLAGRGVATFRYQFPYLEQGKRRPDPHPILLATVRSAVEAAAAACPDLPLVAGGKSMGGRMTSLAAAKAPLPQVRGIVFLGFPLHGIGKPPSIERAEHLQHVTVPMLFLQGTRDKLADLALMTTVCAGISGATLEVVDGADHGFHVLKRTGRSDPEVLDQLGRSIIAWSATVLPEE